MANYFTDPMAMVPGPLVGSHFENHLSKSCLILGVLSFYPQVSEIQSEWLREFFTVSLGPFVLALIRQTGPLDDVSVNVQSASCLVS